MQDDHGYTTLHTACARHEASPTTENIKILVEASPILLTYKTSSGQTPLHVACESADGYMNHDDFFSIIEFLIESNREVIAWKDNNGKLPLHYIYWGRFSLEQLLALLRLHMPLLPQLMTVKDSDGKTPDQCGYRRLQNFTTQATRLLEEEYFTKEMIKWTNEVAEASCKTIPAVSIVMDWTKTKCLENLALIESELNDLVAATESENSV
jgi:hypothetical protein